MVNLAKGLMLLLKGYYQATSESGSAMLIFDREGLLIAQYPPKDGDSQESLIYGAIASHVEPTLQRIISEYPGTFGTGTFETEEHKLVFTEAGNQAILLSIFSYDVYLQKILPYTFLVSEKIAGLLNNPQSISESSLIVPNLHLGYELPLDASPKQDFNTITDTENPDKFEMRFKLIVIGDPAVGKTSLINQFVTRRFSKDYLPTLGISITNQLYKMQGFDNKLLNFMIWDLAGQKFFKRVRKAYYQAANAAFLMYDITRRTTFENIESWYNDLREVIPKIPVVIIGNKSDLTEERQVETHEGQELARKFHCSFMETSAKSGENVKDAFSIVGIGLFFELKSSLLSSDL